MEPPPVHSSSTKDEEALKLLSTFHYVLGGIIGLIACIPFIHVIIGLVFVFAPENTQVSGDMPPEAFGWMFVAIGSFCILMGWTFAILVILAGRKLARRKGRMYCLIVGGLLCAFFPFGTALGVFSLMVLLRDSVRVMFEEGSSVASATSPA